MTTNVCVCVCSAAGLGATQPLGGDAWPRWLRGKRRVRVPIYTYIYLCIHEKKINNNHALCLNIPINIYIYTII